MNRLLRDLGLILVFATLWARGGYLIGLALEMTFLPDMPLKVILASLNVIIGLLLLKGVTASRRNDRLAVRSSGRRRVITIRKESRFDD